MPANSNKLVKKKILWQAHEGNISGANLAMLEYIDVLQNEFDFSVILPHEGSMKQALVKRKIPFFVIRQYGWANRANSFHAMQQALPLLDPYVVHAQSIHDV